MRVCGSAGASTIAPGTLGSENGEKDRDRSKRLGLSENAKKLLQTRQVEAGDPVSSVAQKSGGARSA